MTHEPEPPEYPPARGLLAGKTVLVTAAAGTGIGFATAKRCIEEGARVVISDIHERRLTQASEQLGELAREAVLAVRCDVTIEAEVQALLEAAVRRHGQLDVLINNAG